MEVWLTSEDLGAYGYDIGITLPDLLWKLVSIVPSGCMLRLGMTNPPYIMEHMEVCIMMVIRLDLMQHCVCVGHGSHLVSS